MICLICRKAELVEGSTSVMLVRDEIHLLVNGVPAQVCPNCKDAVVEEDVAIKFLDAAEEVALTGMRDNVLEYEKILN